MKKLSVMLAAVFLLGSVSLCFAYDTGVVTAGELSLGGADGAPVAGTMSADSIVIGLSPKVYARYINPGTTDATAQWFSICTAHPGGNVIYGTAQNLNNLYKKSFITGTPLSTSNMDIPAAADSASDWSTNGWSMN